jgi:hypothetical protein
MDEVCRKRMRIARIIAAFAGIVMLVSASFAVVRWIMANRPIANCLEPVFDFGDIASGSTYLHQFRIQNLGRKTLEILEVRAGCRCSRVDPLTQQQVAPGGWAPINVRYTPEDRSGIQQSHILVRLNDPKQPTLVLVLRALIKTPVVFSSKGLR